MSYSFYIDDFLLPVAPERLVTKIVNKNQVISLINSEEINILKDKGLTEIEFDFILPSEKYPFAMYSGEFLPPNYFLNKLLDIKRNKRSVKFIVVRTKKKNEVMFNLNMRVSIEDYQIIEDYENGFDTLVSIKLKQFDVRKTKEGYIDENKNILVKESRPFFEDKQKYYILKNNDSLFDVCHMMLGDGDLCQEIAEKNGLKSPLDVVPGMLIWFE